MALDDRLGKIIDDIIDESRMRNNGKYIVRDKDFWDAMHSAIGVRNKELMENMDAEIEKANGMIDSCQRRQAGAGTTWWVGYAEALKTIRVTLIDSTPS